MIDFNLILFGLGGFEIILIFLVIIMLFGSKSLPDLAKGIGKGYKEFKKATDEIKNEIKSESDKIEDEIEDYKREISAESYKRYLEGDSSALNDIKSNKKQEQKTKEQENNKEDNSL